MNNANYSKSYSPVFVCKSQQLCGFFMLKGFKLHNMEQSRDNPNLNVFIFSNSPELQKTIKEFHDWRNNTFNDVYKINIANTKPTSPRTTNTFKE